MPTGDQPFGVIASPDGRRVYTANYGSDNVTVIDTTAKPHPVRLYDVEVGDGPYQLALSPDARTLYVSNFEGHSLTALDLGPQEEEPQHVRLGCQCTRLHRRGVILTEGELIRRAFQHRDTA